MGLFDRFKKQDCEICGKEVGMFGYKKLEDGEICKDCVKLLSPWFEDRRHATVAQIREQIAYRERNAKEHEAFTVSRKIGDEEYIMYIEEVDGVPTRFFVTNRSDYRAENPDIISFKDVVSCVTDIQVRDEEIKEKNAEGQLVSCTPRRYKHHHDFFIKMEIRNNPYFDNIKFRINGSCITLETVGDVGGGFGGAAMARLLKGVGISTAGVQTHSYRNSSENRRYEECRMLCERIEQAVEDGKRGTGNGMAATDPIPMLIGQLRGAPDLATATQLQQTLVMLAMASPNKEAILQQAAQAMADATVRIESGMAAAAIQAQGCRQAPAYQSAPVQEAPRPKFCPNCGAPAEGGKFCQNCGSKL